MDEKEKQDGYVFVKPSETTRNFRHVVNRNCGGCSLVDNCIPETSPAQSTIVFGRRKADRVPIAGHYFMRNGCLFEELKQVTTNIVDIP